MRYFFLFAALLFAASTAPAQISRQDSTRIRELLKEARGSDSIAVADHLVRQAIALGQKSGDDFMMSEAYLIGAMLHQQHQQLSKTWVYADSAIQLRGIEPNEGKAFAYTLKAAVKISSAEMPDALAWYLRAADEYSAIGLSANVARILTTVSLVYHNDVKDYNLGLKYAQRAYSILRETDPEKNQGDIWRAVNAIAINYDDAGKSDSALYFHEINMKSQVPYSYIASTLNNVGNTLLKMGRLNDAKKKFLEALTIHRSNPDLGRETYDFATVFNNLSNVACALGNLKECNALRDSAIYYSVRSNNIEKLLDTYKDGYLNSEKQGDLAQTVTFLKLYMGLKDSLYTTEKAQALSDLQVRYETKEKEQEITLLRAERELGQLQLQQSRYTIAGIIILAGVGALIAFFIIRRKQDKERVLKVVEEEQRQRKHFAAMLNAEEQERTRVAKELHDGLGQLLSMAKLNVSALAIEKTFDETILSNAVEVIDQAATEVRVVSHNLMPALLSTIGLNAALQDFSSRMNRARKMKVIMETADFQQELQKDTEIALYRIIQEITNNVIKHSQASLMKVILYENNGLIELLVSDNGIGLPSGAIEHSSGIGWKNIASRVALLNGKLEVFSSTDFQTNIRIIIPRPVMTMSA